ncbi:alkaline-phosphatase-like protein [Mycotypha africana]|uniref:alkaline-phosphatase-like protein n=1 Tax=Mycotypha africana TaxID=64632 RepID=UPI002300F29E|nr:alkaline-phosphatase-like protein [Mycotypha africana]KAI8992157.1 alkaline-phosphatase-like protein [Mycotypha africana]
MATNTAKVLDQCNTLEPRQQIKRRDFIKFPKHNNAIVCNTSADKHLSTSVHTHYQSIGPSEPDISHIEEESEDHRKRQKLVVIAVITVACILFISGAALGHRINDDDNKEPRWSNGTHTFAPTVILISLDGVVNHDLQLHRTPVLTQIGREGGKAKYMIPSFPPITFPNHWSLVTGLYPEAHGIVGNYFYDTQLNDTFYYKSPDRSWDSKWWGGEPIWITAVKQNKKSGVIMWPGCSTDFNGLTPTYSVAYSDYVTTDEKVNQVFDWLDLPLEDRPQFIGVYVPQIDQAGHAYGPYANETMTQLSLADKSIGRLLEGLEQRNLTDIVNIMIVSDHGMSATDKSRLIYYDDVLTKEELDMIWRIEAEPTLAIRPRPYLNESEAVEVLYQAFQRLKLHQRKLSKDKKAHFEVYKREEFPTRFHFNQLVNRIPPLLAVPDSGWNFVTRKRYDPDRGLEYQPKGVHGYDNQSPDSRAIFVAKGPAFRAGELLEPFWNVELYNVMTRILYLNPAQNNNTLNGVLKVAEQEEYDDEK